MKEFSVVGRVVDKPTIFGEDWEVITQATFLPGWHVIMTELYPVFEPFQVFPEKPARVYAGAPTTFLQFADQAEWESFAWALEDGV